MKFVQDFLKVLIVFSFLLLMGFTSRGCSLFDLVFFADCTNEIISLSTINDFGLLHKGEGLYAADSGKIYVQNEYCNFGIDVYIVSNGENLNRIAKFIPQKPAIIVGNGGTIVRSSIEDPYNFIIINSPTQNNLNYIFRDDVETVPLIAVGDVGTVLKSTDDGLTWSLLPFPLQNNLFSSYVRGDTIYVGGENYSLLKTGNNGKTWISAGPGDVAVSSGPSSYNRIYFYDDNLGFVGGPNGFILKTTDGGITWSIKNAQGFDEVKDLYFISPDSGFAVGPNGVARFTFDGGDTWFEDSLVTEYLDGRDIKRIYPMGKYYGSIIGSGGLNTFLAPDSTYLDSIGVATSVKNINNIPQEFLLKQNYPNPFNPTTKIEFQLKETGFTTLKVYDLLGKEISTLVDEELSPGNYKYSFDASELSSGIYFYQLSSGNFVETKKLVLLR